MILDLNFQINIGVNMDSHPWIPNLSEKDLRDMFKAIGIKDVKELFNDIPRKIVLKRILKVGLNKSLSEIEVYKYVHRILSKNKSIYNLRCFVGGGVWPHYVPAVVKEIIGRSEFYTSYTPYQPEASQGVLQALFEYQSLMSDLLEMDIVNASLYDWSTAIAEAFLMTYRLNKRKKFLIPSTMNPRHLEVVKTITAPWRMEMIKIKYDAVNGVIDLNDLEDKIDGNTGGVYIENPSFLGFIETQVDEISRMVHENNSLFIVGVDPISLGVLRPPGKYGADIVVGEGQPLGLGLNYGGPLLGIFAIKYDEKMLRQLPGRLIGMTKTLDGRDVGYTMVLQTREQHIRRERATSNICTNESLCAITAAIYLSLLGRKGLRKISENIFYKCNYALKRFEELNGIEIPFSKAVHFKEFIVKYRNSSIDKVHKYLRKNGIQPGLSLKNDFPEFGEAALYCFTEIHSKDDIDFLIEKISEVI